MRGAEITPWTQDRLQLRIWGQFPAGWAGALSVGLSRRELTIVRGFARRVVQGHWVGELQLRAMPGAPPLAGVDFVELALAEPGPGVRAPIAIHDYYIDRSPDRGGMLFLEVRGEDRVGFLGSLLEGLSALSLAPEEMRIETQADVAFDRFQLRGAAGQLPSEETRLALSRWLDGRLCPAIPRDPAALAAQSSASTSALP
jgi:hypothetical protein